MTKNFLVPLSKAEAALVKRIADQEGITEDEAATRLAQSALANRARKKTGRAPARVYPMKGKK